MSTSDKRFRWRRAVVASCASVVVLVATIQPAGAGGERVFRGRYLYTHSDAFASGKATFRPAIALDDGRALELRFSQGRRPDIVPGSVVEVAAVPQDGALLVADGGTEVVAGASTVAAATSSDVAVLLFNFSNDRSQPYTRAHARGVAFTNTDSVAAYYDENSYGQLTLTGDVFGWYELANDNAGCAVNSWGNAAMAAATADGVSLSRYEHVVFAFPAAPSCAWAGMAQLPGRYSWLNGTGAMGLRVFSHELGHNLGTHHASTLSCSSGGSRVPLIADVDGCSVSEYGDPFTVMGSSSRLHVTNISRGNAGWISSGNTSTVTASGDHLLTPVAVPGGDVKAIRIARSADTSLFLEFRQPYGTQFETFSGTSPVASGVSVRIAPAYSSRTQSFLVDTTPATATFSDAPLTAGATLVDPLTGVSITTLSVGASGATVRVEFPGGPPPDAEDTRPPEPPSRPRGHREGRFVFLRWRASTDDVGVEGYRVFRNDHVVAVVHGRRFEERLPRAGMSPTYRIRAFDAAGNVSRSSPRARP